MRVVWVSLLLSLLRLNFVCLSSPDIAIQFWTYEEEPVGTLIGTIEQLDSTKSYRIDRTEIGGTKLVLFEVFQLNSTTRELRNAVVIDRETLGDGSNFYELLILSEPESGEQIQAFSVAVNVLDINDNAPAFPDSNLVLVVPEDETVGFAIPIPVATDSDFGDNGINHNSYVFEGLSNVFELHTVVQSQSSYSLSLKLVEALDRETTELYEFELYAFDGSLQTQDTPLSELIGSAPNPPAVLTISVNVGDVNDNAPLFAITDYYVSFKIPVAKDSLLVQVEATDVDSGNNGAVSYFVETTSNSGQSTGLFSVSPQSGRLTVTREFESSSNYSEIVTVAARDSGSPSQKSQCRVHVLFYTANAHAPEITIIGAVYNTNLVPLPEDTEVDGLICSIQCIDKDEANAGTVSLFHFQEDQAPLPFKIQQVTSSTWNTVLVEDVDSRLDSQFSLQLVCIDNGNPKKSAVETVTFVVTRVTQLVPQFTQANYTVQVAEDVPTGSLIEQVEAIIENDSTNSVIYQIESGNELTWFTINQQTGLVTTRMPLDREQVDQVVLNVSVLNVNGGGGTTSGPTKSFATIKVIILDVNDNSPTFWNLPNSIEVKEDELVGQLLVTVNASDSDEGLNGRVTMQIVLENSDISGPSEMFELDSTSGELRLTASLDREEVDSFVVTIEAKDEGEGNAKTTTGFLTINVIDVNDNAPKFYPELYYVSIPSESVEQSEIAAVSASDDDLNHDIYLEYSILSGNEAELYEIDRKSGAIRFIGNSEDLTPGSNFVLRVSARDQNGTGLKSSNNATVHIIVSSGDNNGSKVQFMFQEYTFYVNENTLYPIIGSVNLKIPRDGTIESNDIEFSISQGDPGNLFVIDRKTGLLGLNDQRRLNFEIMSKFFLKVSCRLNDTVLTTNVSVHVMDKNDHAPAWPSNVISVGVSELALPNIVIATLGATDEDSKNQVFFELVEDNSNMFYVSGQQLKNVKSLIDYVDQTLVVKVSAYDNGVPSYSSLVTYNIHVLDENDLAPVFNTPLLPDDPEKAFDDDRFIFEISEWTPVGSIIFILNVTDGDYRKNSAISFSLQLERTIPPSNTRKSPFGVFPNGHFYLAQSVEDENLRFDFYEVNVVAEDNGVPGKRTTQKVVIQILDENDNRPLFHQSQVVFEVKSDARSGEVIGQLKAVDRDRGVNGKVAYLPIKQNPPGGNLFQIDLYSGEIYTVADLQKYCARETTFNVSVTDLGSPPLNGSVEVTIKVKKAQKVEDFFGKFNARVFYARVTENNGINEEALRIEFDGEDNDLSGLVYEFSMVDGSFEPNEWNDVIVLDPQTGMVIMNEIVDREAVGSWMKFDVALKSVFEAEVVHTDLAHVIIKIGDENDNAPLPVEVNGNVVDLSVSENAVPGSKIASVTFTDQDEGLNGVVLYTLESTAELPFDVISDTGEIFLTKRLDYESEDSYDFELLASNPVASSQTSSVRVIVNVENVNDEYPQFTQTQNVFFVPETASINTLITQIQATDKDSTEITFSMLVLSPVLNVAFESFAIDSSSGAIRTSKQLRPNYFQEIYQIEVFACDQDSLCSRKTIEINVQENLFDCEPEVKFTSNVVKYLSTTSTEKVLFRVGASVESRSINLAYELSSNHPLTINSLTGDVSMQSEANRRTAGDRWTFDVSAFDPQNTCVGSSQQIEIFWMLDSELNSLNLQLSGNGKVDENSEDSFGVLSVPTITNDEHEQANIRFSVNSIWCEQTDQDRISELVLNLPLDLLKIDQLTGVVQPSVPIDREQLQCPDMVTQYEVYANGQTGYLETRLEVVNINDVAPVFDHNSVVEVKIPENAEIGSNVWSFRFVDEDSPASIALVSQIPDLSLFTLAPTGVLMLEKDLDFETMPRIYNLTLKVNDTDFDTMAVVMIEITEVNEFAPRCLRMNQEIEVADFLFLSVPENYPQLSSVGKINVEDEDLNQKIFLFTLLNSKEPFEIDPKSGHIRTSKVLDAEQTRFYGLSVEICDLPNPQTNLKSDNSLCNVCEVLIEVENVDDNEPDFDGSNGKMLIEASVEENMPVGTFVAWINMTDADVVFASENNNFLALYDDAFYLVPQIDQLGVFGLHTNRVFDREDFDPCSQAPQLNIFAHAISRDYRYLVELRILVEIRDQDDKALEVIGVNNVSVYKQMSYNLPFFALNFADEDSSGQFGDMNVTYAAEQSLIEVSSWLIVDPANGCLSLKDLFETIIAEFPFKARITLRVEKGEQIAEHQVWINFEDFETIRPKISHQSLNGIALEPWIIPNSEILNMKSQLANSSDQQTVSFVAVFRGVDANEIFYLDASTGVISVNSELNQEISPGFYHMFWFAYSEEHPSLQSEVGDIEFEVSVDAFKDCVKSPKNDGTVLLVPENSPPGEMSRFKLFDEKCSSLINVIETQLNDDFHSTFSVQLDDVFLAVILDRKIDTLLETEIDLEVLIRARNGDGDLFVSSEIIARVQVVDRSLPALRILRIGQQPVVSRNSNSDSSLLSLPQIDHRVKLVTPLYTAAGTVLAQVQTSYDDRKLPTDSSVAFSVSSLDEQQLPFTICETSGEIIVMSKLTTQTEYKAQVTASSVRNHSETHSVPFTLQAVRSTPEEEDPCFLSIQRNRVVLAAPLEVGTFVSQVVCEGGTSLADVEWTNLEGNIVALAAQTGFVTINLHITDLGIYPVLLSYVTHGIYGPFTIELEIELKQIPVVASPQFEALTASVSEGEETDLFSFASADNDVEYRLLGSSCGIEDIEIMNLGEEVLIRTKTSLDFDASCELIEDIYVMATDESGISRIYAVTDAIQVVNRNDHVPSCGGVAAYMSLQVEEHFRGIVSTDLAIEDLDESPFNQTSTKIFPADRNSRAFLDEGLISLINNMITLTASDETPLDRESFPDSFDTEYSLKYIVQVTDIDSELKSTCLFELLLSYANEFVPECSIGNDEQFLEIAETSPIGSKLGRIACRDQDASQYPVNKFSLLEGGQNFEIDEMTGVVRSKTQFDFEDNDRYQLNVLVQNGRLESSLLVEVVVTDENDETPRFEELSTLIVQENEAIGVDIGSISASDVDDSPVKFKFMHLEDEKMFSIDSTSGRIKINGDTIFRSTVQSVQSGLDCSAIAVATQELLYPYEYEVKNLDVCVKQENSHAPQFIHQSNVFKVPENAERGYVITELRAEDEDFGPNGELVFYIENAQLDIFTIEGTELQLLVDLETITLNTKNIEIEVKVSDSGIPQLSFSTIFSVYIVSENTFSIRFSHENYTASIEENLLPGTLIALCRANIYDNSAVVTDEKNIVYSITITEPEAVGEKIEMEALTGRIVATDLVIDYEDVKIFTIHIQATDNLTSVGTLTANAEVVVTIIDINDNVPTFFNPSGLTNEVLVPRIPVLIAESNEENRPILNLSDYIRDQDASFQQSYNFEIITGTDLFFIDNTSYSVLKTNRILSCAHFDYEGDGGIRIRVTDETYEEHFSEAIFEIIVVDSLNNMAPQFQSESYTWPAKESALVETEIGKLVATDGDCSEVPPYVTRLQKYYRNNPISAELQTIHFVNSLKYFLIPSLSAETISRITTFLEFFNLDEETGELTLQQSLNYENETVFDSKVLAVDAPRPRKIASVPLRIVVIDENEAPSFHQELYSATLSETESIGIEILRVSAFDRDKSLEFSNFVFTIKQPNSGVFTIGEQTGVVTNLIPLDRETLGDVLTFEVIVADSVDNQINDVANVTVLIRDVNDNAPVLSGELAENRKLEVNENAPIGTLILVLDAIVDLDSPENGAPFTVDVTGLPARDYIEVVGNELRTKENFDHELTPFVEIPVSITDNGTPEKSSLVKFHLEVKDVNDNPSFAKSWNVNLFSFNFLPNLHIGFLYPDDVDNTSNQFSCSEAKSLSMNELLEVSEKCALLWKSNAQSSLGEISIIQYKSNDGQHADVINSVTININKMNARTEIIANSLFVRIEDLTTDQFLESELQNLVTVLHDLLNESYLVINIWEVKTPDPSMLLLLSPETLSDSDTGVRNRINEVRILSGLKISRITTSACEALAISECINETDSCNQEITFPTSASERSVFRSDSVILNTVKVELKLTCEPEDDSRSHCVDNENGRILICFNYGKCSTSESGQLSCDCSEEFTGQSCEIENDLDMRQCHKEGTVELCQTDAGSFCVEGNTIDDYECICNFPYSGTTCQQMMDICSDARNPCKNGAQCKADTENDQSFRCFCPSGYFGVLCEKASVGFGPSSSIQMSSVVYWEQYRQNDELENAQLKIVIGFSTLQKNALVLIDYEPGLQNIGQTLTNGQFFLELREGLPRLVVVSHPNESSFSDDGEGEKLLELSNDVYCADAVFHEVTITFTHTAVAMQTDDCDTCEQMHTRNSTLVNELSSGSFLFIGGLDHLERNGITAYPPVWPYGELAAASFEGCISKLAINSELKNLLSYKTDTSNVDGDCHRKQVSFCEAESCSGDSTCEEDWKSDFICLCSDYHSGPTCERGVESLAISETSNYVLRLNSVAVSNLALSSNLDTNEDSIGRFRRSLTAELGNSDPETVTLRISFTQLDSNWRTIMSYNFTNDFEEFRLQVSVAAFLISIGSSSWEVSVPEDGLLSGIFYNIELTRNELRLNSFTLSSNDRWENRRRILSSYLDALVFGGLEQGFQGCLLSAKINNERLLQPNLSSKLEDIFTTVIVSSTATQSNVIFCDRSRLCTNSSCPASLSCISLVDRFECLDPTACANNECQHGTSCIPDGNFPSNLYECDCRLNFEGRFCEHSLYCDDHANQCASDEKCVPNLGPEQPAYECVSTNDEISWFVWLMLAGGLVILLTLILAVIIVCLCRLRTHEVSKSESKVGVVMFDNNSSPTPIKTANPVAPDLLAHVPDRFINDNFTLVAPGIEVEENVDDTMLTSTDYKRPEYSHFMIDSRYARNALPFPGSSMAFGGFNQQSEMRSIAERDVMPTVEELEESRTRDRMRSKSSSTTHHTFQHNHDAQNNTTYAESSVTDLENYDSMGGYSTPGKMRKNSNINLTPYIIQSQKEQRVRALKLNHDKLGSLPDYSDHSDLYRRFNNSLNPHFIPKYVNNVEFGGQFELTEPTVSVITERLSPNIPAPIQEDQSGFPPNEDDFSTRSYYQSSIRPPSEIYDLSNSESEDLGAQIQNSKLPRLHFEPMSSDPNINSPDHVRGGAGDLHLQLESGLNPNMLCIPPPPDTDYEENESVNSHHRRSGGSIAHSALSINSPTSLHSRPESNPEKFFQQGNFNSFFKGMINFEALAPVFQDLADLPNIPDLYENEDDDFTQSTSQFVP